MPDNGGNAWQRGERHSQKTTWRMRRIVMLESPRVAPMLHRGHT